FFFSSRRRHTRWPRDWSSDVCSSDLRSSSFALKALRAKLELLLQNPKDVNVGQVTTLIGILTDKIDRARGLDVKRVEHEHKLDRSEERRVGKEKRSQSSRKPSEKTNT